MKALRFVSFFLLLLPGAHAQDFFTNGLVAYYPFNGNALDASGNGNDGAVQGATLTTNRFGVPNSAYSFDGISSRIVFPETLFGPTNPAVTISAWITTDSGSYTGQQVIVEKSGLNGEMQIKLDSGLVEFGPHLSSGDGWYFATAPMLLNSAMHLVGVYQNGLAASLYTNGVLAQSVSLPTNNLAVDLVFPLTSAVGIYDYVPGPYAAFRGIIDDVRVYTNALSATDVQRLYTTEAKPFTASLSIGVSKVRVTMYLEVGQNYVLQSSHDMITWTTIGSSFTAAAPTLSQEFDVVNIGQYFRLQTAP